MPIFTGCVYFHDTGLPPQLSSLAVRIMVRSVICTASDDSCGGGLGTRLQVMHERSRICRFAHAKLVTFELIKKKKLSFLLNLMRPGLTNNEFTYHGLRLQNNACFQRYVIFNIVSSLVCSPSQPCINLWGKH